MSINSELVKIAQENLVIRRDSKERGGIMTSLGHLEKVIKDKLGQKVVEVKKFGSFTRNTILPRAYDPKSDVDLLVIMNTSEREYNPGTFRKWLKDVVELSYSNSISKKDFPSVKLEMNHIIFDLVPSIIRQGFWGNDKYYIPGAADSWIETDPNDFNSELSDANQYYGSNTVRHVIRLMKLWNARKKYPFQSYLLEKDIASLNFSGDDTYEGFKYALKKLAMDKANTRQALEHIDMYHFRGDYNNEVKWVNRLLAGS